MINIIKKDQFLLLKYEAEIGSPEWVYQELTKNRKVTLRGTFTLTMAELVSDLNNFVEDESILFVIGTKQDNYYRLSKSVLGIENALYIHKDIKVSAKTFITACALARYPCADGVACPSIGGYTCQ